MLKMGLLTSTAMTAVTLLLSGAAAGAFAQSDMHVADRDSNARFLCTYGQFEVSFSYSSDSSGGASWWEHVAVPVIGHGQTVGRITVMEVRNSRTHSAFSAGIYSDSRKGLPGKLIAGGTGKANTICGQVKVSIPPTTLKPNTKYWIVETAGNTTGHNSSTSVYWAVNPNTRKKAYVQKGRWYCNSSCIGFHQGGQSSKSPWTEQNMGPWFKLK